MDEQDTRTAGYLAVKNWDKFQHYRDRKPVWIKMYVELLDDEVYKLTDRQFGQLVKLWLLAGRTDNRIPDSADVIGHMIGTPPEELEVEMLVEKRYLRRTKSQRRRSEKWPSRYIPKSLREQVLARDESKCVQCSASLWLEIDHIVPVSRGGRGTLENLQTLCRSCNRAKRAKDAEELRSSQSSPPRSLEKEKEVDKEKTMALARQRANLEAADRFVTESAYFLNDDVLTSKLATEYGLTDQITVRRLLTAAAKAREVA